MFYTVQWHKLNKIISYPKHLQILHPNSDPEKKMDNINEVITKL